MTIVLRHNYISTTNPEREPITEADLRRFTPSILAAAPHDARSEGYGFVATTDILEKLRALGFNISQAQQQNTHSLDRKAFTKHLIKLRHENTRAADHSGGLVPEILLTNSHDGSCSYSIMAGIFRFICGNGLVIADEQWGNIRVQHRGAGVMGEVVEASFRVIDNAAQAIKTAAEWQRIPLVNRQQMDLAEEAHAVRFGKTPLGAAIRPVQLLQMRRTEDTGSDLWTTVNRIQENAIKGGLSNFRPAAIDGKPRRLATMRAITGIGEDLRINREIWALGAKAYEELGV